MIPFRDDQCPERGPGLSHHAEPPSWVCWDCNVQCVIEDFILERENDFDLEVVIGERECVADHSSLVPRRHHLDDGDRWAHCPICDVQIEETYPQIGPQGPSYGKGRTGSHRAQSEWAAKLGYMKWYYEKVEP